MPLDNQPPVRLIAAPFTPLAPSGALDVGLVASQAERLRASGVAGVFICGTTGESASLHGWERRQLAEAWRTHAGELELIVHVGSTNLDEAVILARHAEAIGADAIGAVPPYYFRPSTVDQLVDAVEPVAGAAPTLPFFYYHIPAMTKVELPMVPFLDAARSSIPNFAGIKFTHADLLEYAACIAAAGDELDIMFGRDPLLLFALAAGGTTAVGSTFMFAAPLYHELAAAFRTGDLDTAREATAAATAIVDVANRFGGLAAQKALYSMTVVDVGPSRPPLPPVGPAGIEALMALADRGGLGTRADRARRR